MLRVGQALSRCKLVHVWAKLFQATANVMFNNQHAAGGDHWQVRRAAADCLARLVLRFPQPQLNLVPRISSLCISTLLDSRKALTSHYGAIAGLAALGPRAVAVLLLPRLLDYYDRLLPALSQVCYPEGFDHKTHNLTTLTRPHSHWFEGLRHPAFNHSNIFLLCYDCLLLFVSSALSSMRTLPSLRRATACWQAWRITDPSFDELRLNLALDWHADRQADQAHGGDAMPGRVANSGLSLLQRFGGACRRICCRPRPPAQADSPARNAAAGAAGAGGTPPASAGSAGDGAAAQGTRASLPPGPHTQSCRRETRIPSKGIDREAEAPWSSGLGRVETGGHESRSVFVPCLEARTVALLERGSC